MIESILSNIYIIERGFLIDDGFVFPIQRENAPFTLSDSKSCEDCHKLPNRKDRLACNEVILKVNNRGSEIAVVRFEEFIKKFPALNQAQRCDFLMSDSGMNRQKIVFCDLCCYEEKYVEPNSGSHPEGKRAKARQQMKRSIELLIDESTTAVNLLTYKEKVCLFAWRDYTLPVLPVVGRGSVLANMQAFTNVASATAKQLQWEDADLYGFSFVQVKYPSEYEW